MKKLLAMILAAVLVLSLGTAALAANDSVTLNVVTSYGGDDGNRANFEAAVKAYEASTGNKVNDGSATSNEEWKAKVLTDFETGSEPDVLSTSPMPTRNPSSPPARWSPSRRSARNIPTMPPI